MIPPQVWQKAVELIGKRYPLSVVAEEVGVSLRDVYRIREAAGLATIAPDPSPSKIRLVVRQIQAGWTNTQWASHWVEKPLGMLIPLIHVADFTSNTTASILDVSGDFPENG